MDPNEQEADQKLIEAREMDETAGVIRGQGDEEAASELEEKSQELNETAEQQKMDTEGLINQEKAANRQNSSNP